MPGGRFHFDVSWLGRNKYRMRLAEIQPVKPIKPRSPDQQRIASLKATADRAKAAVKAERARQQQRKSQQTLAKVQQQLKQTAA
jgi:hypothetical protein